MMNNPEYIVAIAEEQSLLKAAEKLFVTPSALSQYVSKLEAQLNTPLFTRSRAGWSPTTAGLLYIDLAKNVVALEHQTYTQISTVTSSFPCTISIGISPGRMVDMMASCFPAFNARFPNIKLVLREAPVFGRELLFCEKTLSLLTEQVIRIIMYRVLVFLQEPAFFNLKRRIVL